MDQIPSDSTNLKQVNVFTNRFDFELESEDISAILAKDTNELKGKWSAIGNFKIEKPNLKSTSASDDNYKQPADVLKATDLQLLKVQMSLTLNVSYPLSTEQTELFHMANSYLDLYYPQRTHDNAEEIRYVYCLHTVNHILKSRALILRNNEKINELVKNPKQPTSEMSLPDSVRDQGLTRMKALIILPFRDSALKTVQIISKLLFENRKGTYSNSLNNMKLN